MFIPRIDAMPMHSRTDLPTSALSFRVNAREKMDIQASAADAAMTVGEYIRRKALNQVITHRFDIDAIAELRRQGGLLKHLHNEGLLHDRQTAYIVDAIASIISSFDGVKK